MKTVYVAVSLLLGVAALPAQNAPSLQEARAGFETKIVRKEILDAELEEPPAELFELVEYDGPAGTLQAYVGKPPAAATEGSKHPAILWLTGGFPQGGIGSEAWSDYLDLEDDQTAMAWRRAGMVMMYPTLRGSFGNDGQQEGFYGEVDDVLAALEYARSVDWIDPERIYLGGHSTGGTLALLVAAATDQFRGVIAFGPVEDPTEYGEEYAMYDLDSKRERDLRAPIRFVDAIRCPTLVIEGEGGNFDSLESLQKACKNDLVQFVPVLGAGHFDVLAPINRLLAGRLAAKPADRRLPLSPVEAVQAVAEARLAVRESDDLWGLSQLRDSGLPLREPLALRFSIIVWFDDDEVAATVRDLQRAAKKLDAEVLETETGIDEDGDRFWQMSLVRTLRPIDLEQVFETSQAVDEIARKRDLYYDGLSAR